AALAEAVALNDAAAKAAKNELQKKRLMGAGKLMQNYTARLGDMKEVLKASGNIRQTQLNVLAQKISGEFRDLQAAVTGAQ
ncbi:methyl-accepting chemotaxis protein, partial [Rhizobium ruizarguesonis]